MPLPLKPGFNFNYDRSRRPAHYEMAAAEAYTDFYGISYMVSGERMIYSPEFSTIVKAGEMVFIPKNVYRRTTWISDMPYERILLKFTDCMVSDLFETIREESYNELCREHVVRFEKETRDKVRGILDEMEREWNAYNQYSELILKGLLHKLIIISLRERVIGGVNVMSLEKKHDCLAEAIKYIKTHLRESPSLEEVSRHVNISSSYLSKVFINYLDTPFSTFVMNEKMAYARKLLVDTRLNMTEIAIEAGFSGSACFSDCFKRRMGMSPMQFRKENKGK